MIEKKNEQVRPTGNSTSLCTQHLRKNVLLWRRHWLQQRLWRRRQQHLLLLWLHEPYPVLQWRKQQHRSLLRWLHEQQQPPPSNDFLPLWHVVQQWQPGYTEWKHQYIYKHSNNNTQQMNNSTYSFSFSFRFGRSSICSGFCFGGGGGSGGGGGTCRFSLSIIPKLRQ